MGTDSHPADTRNKRSWQMAPSVKKTTTLETMFPRRLSLRLLFEPQPSTEKVQIRAHNLNRKP